MRSPGSSLCLCQMANKIKKNQIGARSDMSCLISYGRTFGWCPGRELNRTSARIGSRTGEAEIGILGSNRIAVSVGDCPVRAVRKLKPPVPYHIHHPLDRVFCGLRRFVDLECCLLDGARVRRFPRKNKWTIRDHRDVVFQKLAPTGTIVYHEEGQILRSEKFAELLLEFGLERTAQRRPA